MARTLALMQWRMSVARWVALFGCAGVLCAPRSARADEWWGADKALHFGVSSVLSGGSYALSSLVLDSRLSRVAVGAGIGLTAGVAKEVYDELDYGGASYKDLAFDVAGVAVGVVAAWLIDLAIERDQRERVKTSGTQLLIRF